MRNYLLTENERKIITRYLETDEKLDGFAVLLHRAKADKLNRKQIDEDLNLIEKFQQKAGTA